MRSPVWGASRAGGPAGLIHAPVAEVLAFARLHLKRGLGPDGARLLSEESAVSMTELQAELPDQQAGGDSWGLGVRRYACAGHRMVGHDGNLHGQMAYLRLLPDDGLAFALLTNGGFAPDLSAHLQREILAELLGIEMPPPLAPPAEPVRTPIERYVGTYERTGVRFEVFTGTEGPRLRRTATGPSAQLVPEPVQEFAMVGIADDFYVVRPDGAQTWVPVRFYELENGSSYIHHALRATPKTD